MHDLKVTLVQANQVWENKMANFKNYEGLLDNCGPTDLIVLPEMFQTAFSMNSAVLAEEMESGESISWLKQQAKKHNAAFYTSLIISENGSYYNRGLFVYPSGEIVIYDKRHRFAMAGEDQFFSAGKTEQIVEYKGWKINLQICYDLRFPENVRNVEINGTPKYDLIIYVANWPERRVSHWKALLQARAIENQSYVIGVNRVGTDDLGLNYSGESAIYNALGDKISNLSINEESISQNVLSFNSLEEVRLKLPFLRDSSNQFIS